MNIVEQLQEADKTLESDGYKSYSHTRIAISEAIRLLSNPNNGDNIQWTADKKPIHLN